MRVVVGRQARVLGMLICAYWMYRVCSIGERGERWVGLDVKYRVDRRLIGGHWEKIVKIYQGIFLAGAGKIRACLWLAVIAGAFTSTCLNLHHSSY